MQAHNKCTIESTILVFHCCGNLLATIASYVWFKGSLSGERDEQSCLFSQSCNVGFIVCLLLYPFLLKLFALQNTLGKGWFLSLLVCVFFFKKHRLTLAIVCSCHWCTALPALASSTSLSAKNSVIVCVPFLILNHGRILQKRNLNCVHGLSE